MPRRTTAFAERAVFFDGPAQPAAPGWLLCNWRRLTIVYVHGTAATLVGRHATADRCGHRRIRRWWTAPAHYDWLSVYLANRGVRSAVQRSIALAVFFLGGIEFLMVYSPAGTPRGLPALVAVGITAGCLVMGALWLRNWPTRTQSAAFVAVSALAIGSACLIEASTMSGLMAASLFSLLGGYAGIFHSMRLVILNIAVAVVVATILAFEIAETDPVLAVAKLLAVVGMITVIPVMCQTLFQILAPDALNSGTDPLTGLLNRRGFYARAVEQFEHVCDPQDPHLMLAMVDLDRFKQLNDTAGHQAGDNALVAVGEALIQCAPANAVVARYGGEEFVVMAAASADEAAHIAADITHAIARTPHHVTASVGAVTVPLAACRAVPINLGLATLVGLADKAMYEAKRAGCDRFCHRTAAAIGDAQAR